MVDRITCVVTRGGDDGSTSLASGERVRKDSLRIGAYGTVDELNSVIALARATLGDRYSSPEPDWPHQLDRWLEAIQHDLFNIGADLATSADAHWPGMIRVQQVDVDALESVLGACQDELAPLRDFVLPGGHRLNAELHLARTVCRRTERLAVELSAVEDVNPLTLKYLNRLSDLFFVLSRWVLCRAKLSEQIWSRDAGIRACARERCGNAV